MQSSKKPDKKTHLPVAVNTRPLKQRRTHQNQQHMSQIGLSSQRSQIPPVIPLRSTQQLLSFLNNELDLGVQETDLTKPSPQRTIALYQLFYYQFFWWKDKTPQPQQQEPKKQESKDILRAQMAAYKKFNGFLKKLNCPLSYGEYCSSTAQTVHKVLSNIAAFYATLKSSQEKSQSLINEILSIDEDTRRMLEDKQKRVSDYIEKENVIRTAEQEAQRMDVENQQLDAEIRQLRQQIEKMNLVIFDQKAEKTELRDVMSTIYLSKVAEEQHVALLKKLTQINVTEAKASIQKMIEEQPLLEEEREKAQIKKDEADQTYAKTKDILVGLKKCVESVDQLKKLNQQVEGLQRTLNTVQESYAKEQALETELKNEMKYVDEKLAQDQENFNNVKLQRAQKREMTEIEWEKLTKQWDEQNAKLKEAEEADALLVERIRKFDLEITRRKTQDEEYKGTLMEGYRSLYKAVSHQNHLIDEQMHKGLK